MDTSELPKLFTEAQAASYLGVAEITLRRQRAAHRIAYVRIGRQARYTEAHLLSYIEQQTYRPTLVALSASAPRVKGQPSGTRNGGTRMDAGSALRLAQQIVSTRKR